MCAIRRRANRCSPRASLETRFLWLRKRVSRLARNPVSKAETGFRAGVSRLMQEPGPIRRVPWGLLLGAVLFAIAHTQAPLYYSNQNTYFGQGAADAGHGQLRDDWLANTRDPTPVFSTLVAVTDRFVGEWAFHVYYFALLMVYFISLVKLCDALPFRPSSPLARLLFFMLLIGIHAAVLRVESAIWLGVDYPWFFQCGVANQYVLGPALQPSAFGVLLVTSVAAFAHGRPWLAAGCACAAAILHSTYLLPAALLTVGYMAALRRERGDWPALLLGAGSLAAVSPVVVYNVVQFTPTSPADFSEAQRLLAEVRIPHHAVIDRWLDVTAWAQIAWIVLGLLLLRGTRLFLALGVSSILALA